MGFNKAAKVFGCISLSVALVTGFIGVSTSTHVEELQYKIDGYKLQSLMAQNYKEYALSRGVDEHHQSMDRANEVIVYSDNLYIAALAKTDDAVEMDKHEKELEILEAEAIRDSEILELKDKLISDNITTEELLHLQELITDKINEKSALNQNVEQSKNEDDTSEYNADHSVDTSSDTSSILTDSETREILIEVIKKLQELLDTTETEAGSTIEDGEAADTENTEDTQPKESPTVEIPSEDTEDVSGPPIV